MVTTGILVLAVTASAVTAWMTTNNMRSLLLKEGLQVADSLARQSTLALLYESGENAMDAAHTTLAFPAVSHVQLYNHAGRVLLDEGGGGRYSGQINAVNSRGGLLAEDGQFWYFSAPVYSVHPSEHDQISEVAATEGMSEVLGQVVVTIRKEHLQRMQTDTVVNNLLVGLLIAAILAVLLRRQLNRLTEPLNRLSEKMAMAEQGDQGLYDTTDGPFEVMRIAKAYNSMTEALAERDARLREHNVRLEHEVATRTEELVRARDVALEASKNKSEFLSKMSHELRTPLQAIIGYADVMRDTLAEEGLKREVGDVEKIIHNADHLLSIINDILDLARIEAGRIPLHVAEVYLPDIVSKAEDAVGALVRQNHNSLVIQLEGCDGLMQLDGAKLSQILINLLGNAAKFTYDGVIVLHAKCQHDRLVISVQDTGIGIDERNLAIIFEPFRQVDGSDTRQFQGTGLGLTITRQFCQLMGGDVDVKSKTGVGTTFTVALPITAQLSF